MRSPAAAPALVLASAAAMGGMILLANPRRSGALGFALGALLLVVGIGLPARVFRGSRAPAGEVGEGRRADKDSKTRADSGEAR